MLPECIFSALTVARRLRKGATLVARRRSLLLPDCSPADACCIILLFNTTGTGILLYMAPTDASIESEITRSAPPTSLGHSAVSEACQSDTKRGEQSGEPGNFRAS
jgi:hypothetical protein